MPYILLKNTSAATLNSWQFDTLGEALIYARDNLLTEAEFLEMLLLGNFVRPDPGFSLEYYQGTLPTNP